MINENNNILKSNKYLNLCFNSNIIPIKIKILSNPT